MNLKTRYLGLELDSPLIPGASPLADTLDGARALEDAGAPALVMRSLFEEQITREQQNQQLLEEHEESSYESTTFLPKSYEFVFGPEAYLEHLRKLKGALGIPVIASLNGISVSGWLQYAQLIEQAGADALELNVYYLSTNPEESAFAVENRTLELVRLVKKAVRIPLAVKLSPFFSALPHFAGQLEEARADALILFNRFYQPDIDAEKLEATASLHLSDSSELLLRLRWLAVLFGEARIPLAASGGVHTGMDAIKAVMAGASAVQVVSVLLRRGPQHLRTLRQEMIDWMNEHDYVSLAQMRGSMSLHRCPDPSAFSRANYMRILQTWRPQQQG